ncbi:Zn-dependent hydrolase [Acinetobacter baumannii]|uniref:Zn-dependent hydrolase n=1 Tax=Acinetobacter baumannii TaxID=470 RepID=UPI001C0B2DB9|nr:Zn-dependent hydrolase [Acinetobacter baumannii]MBU3166685.1 Zn-dependent hydrolase [Acinetobacter baumannii]
MDGVKSLQKKLSIDGELLIKQINELGNIGADSDVGGRTRIALTDDEKKGRDLIVQWMNELSLNIEIDEIGNIFGTLPSINGNCLENVLMMGSHIDTVQNAGALDGCYGVLAGLAVVRAYREAGILPSRPITVAAFTNEEGVRYQPDMMGSLVYAGGMPVQEALNVIGTDGTRLGDELARIGYAGHLKVGTIIPQEYVELHIEQGPILEKENIEIGAVENLQGISWQQIIIKGKANHAGTTPTEMRHDAGFAAALINTFLRELALETKTTLATVGSVKFHPNLINVIPRMVEFSVDLRDPDESKLKNAENKLNNFLKLLEEEEGVQVEQKQLARFEPVHFDEKIVQLIESSAKKLGFSYRRMTSGAGHDAQMIARIAPTAMIFVPSKGGVSHNPREFTEPKQLINGANVLLEVVQNLV